MKPLPERLNERLEQHNARSSSGEGAPDWLLSPVHALSQDPEADELVALALRLQSAPPLQVDPDYAWQLEQRILTRNAALHRERPVRGWSFPRLLRAHPVFRVALSLCLLLLLLGTGVLVAAAQMTNPDSPLYVVKHWEQQVQVSLAHSPENQAQLDLQFAQDRLKTLVTFADAAHAQAYSKALVELDQQFSAAARASNALPAGAEHDRVESQLATLQADARHTLRGLLLQLALPERLLTTDELGRLDDTVPHLVSAEMVLPAHQGGQATISIAGEDIQPGAQLLVDTQLMDVRGSLQNGWYVFVANWVGNQHPQRLGILNSDGTAAQTTTITLNSSDDHGNNNGNGNHGGNGNGNSKGKP
jgi:Domain of unknown function (DUF5667)